MYTKETYAQAESIMGNKQFALELFQCLETVCEVQLRGIKYSNQDFDIKQRLASVLHTFEVKA